MKMLAGIIKPDDEDTKLPRLNVSYKPQTISPKFEGTVRDLLFCKLNISWTESLFKTEVTIPLDLDSLLEKDVKTLSGGELQRLAIILVLAAKPPATYTSLMSLQPTLTQSKESVHQE